METLSLFKCCFKFFRYHIFATFFRCQNFTVFRYKTVFLLRKKGENDNFISYFYHFFTYVLKIDLLLMFKVFLATKLLPFFGIKVFLLSRKIHKCIPYFPQFLCL